MEENIKEYLNINAPKYAEFKGYDESFINEVKDFTKGASPTDLVQLFYDEAISKLKEGGLIPKFLNGSAGVSSADREKDLRGSWRDEVFSKLQQELFNKLKLGLEGKEGGITMELFNDYQSKHANIYNRIKGTDFYTKAYRPEKKGEVSELLGRYLNHGFNDLAIKPNWESRYHINSNNPNSGDNPLEWTTDDLYSAITDDRRFGRDGDFTNPQHLEDWLKLLKEIGYKYELDKNGDGYYKLSKLNPENQELETKPGNQEKVTPPVQTKSDLQATVPTIGKKSFGEGIWNGVLKGVPHAIEALKFLDAYRTNKRMYEHALKNYTWAPMAFTPKHLNIYGDLAALNLGYNNAADVQSLAARMGNNTVDYRTAAAINLQGNSNANKIRTEAGTKFNDLARSTSEKATTQEFDNIDKLQEAANENRNRFAAYLNALLTNDLGYMNQLHMNRTNLFNHIAETAMYKNLDLKEVMGDMLKSQMTYTIENDPKVLAAKRKYQEAKTTDEQNVAWSEYVEARKEVSNRVLPTYYERLATLKGVRFKYTDNPFIQYAKSGTKVSDDGPVKRRAKDLERRRKERKDRMHYNDKLLERLGRLTYLWAKRAQGK